jgi:geranylgeranyl diphosphate synthase type II
MEYLIKYKNAIDTYIENHLEMKDPKGLYDPMYYGLHSEGKRIRPILALMGCHLFTERFKEALPAAFAVEIFHNFTLLHDDIMDGAELRRGKPSVYQKFGIPAAILSGDAMMIYGYKFLLEYTNPKIAYSLIQIMTKNAIGVCEGQQLDMDFENENMVSIDDYIEMIAKKTSILLGASLEMGGVVGNADENQQHHLFEFGKNIGIAFQIHDDILDVFGEELSIGKMSGGDIINNKKTYLYLKSLELASAIQKQRLTNLYSSKDYDSTEKIDEVKNIFTLLGVKEYANQLKVSYLDLGISHLMAIGGNPIVENDLKKLSHYIIEREN